jgi:hypothetical protein
MRSPRPTNGLTIKRSRGFLLVVAVLVVTVVALAIVALGTMLSADIRSSSAHAQSEQAYFVAQSGLERATRASVSPILAERISCATMTGNANLTGIAVGQGRFTVTGGAFGYPVPSTLPAGGVSAAASIIPVASTAGYSAQGRVMIDRESIDYISLGAGAAACGAGVAACFLGAQRGAAGTVAAAHAANTGVGQFQCNVQASGGVPDLVAPQARRVMSQGTQLQEAWAVGAPGGVTASPWVLRFREDTWSQVDTTLIAVSQQLNAISMLSYADGFAVGNPGAAANRPFVMRWNGAAWAAVNTGLAINRALDGISCVAANDCWAVGVAGAAGQRPWIVRYNGAWSSFNSALINVNANLNSIYCFDTNNCMAVGDPGPAAASRPFTVLYGLPGPAWTAVNNTVINQNLQLFGVHCALANDCWAVGQFGAAASRQPYALRWNGAAWTEANNAAISVPQNLNSVYCNSASDCWAVGNPGAVAAQRPFVVRWNGVAWSLFNTGLNLNLALNGVHCENANDCWAVGNNDALGELILKWDGAAWTRVAPSAGLDNRNLLAIQGVGAAKRAPAARREVYP